MTARSYLASNLNDVSLRLLSVKSEEFETSFNAIFNDLDGAGRLLVLALASRIDGRPVPDMTAGMSEAEKKDHERNTQAVAALRNLLNVAIEWSGARSGTAVRQQLEYDLLGAIERARKLKPAEAAAI